MAQMNYPHAPTGCTPGEKTTFNTLKRHLPENYYAWYEPTIFGKKASARPDFIILGKDTGVTIIEVKDWSLDKIHSADRNHFQILINGTLETRTNPEKQVEYQFRKFSEELNRYQTTELDKYSKLITKGGKYKGKLAFSVSKLVAFPNITRLEWENSDLQLFHMINSELVLLKEDFGDTLLLRLQKARFFRTNLSDEQINTLRWMISPDTRVPLSQGKLFSLSPQQAGIAKIDTYLPPEALRLSKKSRAILVRGVVGSGKTLILLFRAKFISEQNPNWKVLVLTYNKSLTGYLQKIFKQIGGDLKRVEIVNFHKWCSNQLKPHGLYTQSPIDKLTQKNIVQEIQKRTNSTKEFHPQFLVDEFNWIKERIDYKHWANYPDTKKISRKGRGKGLGRSEEQKRKRIYNLFLLYQKRLKKMKKNDWADIPVLLQKAIDDKRIQSKQYHAIMIDEAQDFAPSWFKVAFRMVKPETNMVFIVGDGAQKIYRHDFTWKELGLAINPRNSYVLKHSYRNTSEIINVALEVIQNSQTLVTELKESGDSVIEAETVSDLSRHGPLPVLLGCNTPQQEHEKIAKQILELQKQGFLISNMVILHRYRNKQDQIIRSMHQYGITCTKKINTPQSSVKVSTFHNVKGLEFDVVFICGLEDFKEDYYLNNPTEENQGKLNKTRKLLYVGLTRARYLLYITYSGTPPKWIIERIKNKVRRV